MVLSRILYNGVGTHSVITANEDVLRNGDIELSEPEPGFRFLFSC